MKPPRFAKIVFRISAIYGFLVLIPQYLLEKKIGTDTPPPITHPEYFYGFVGVGLAWQLLFWAISNDPVRLRPAMPAGAFEKIAFGVAVFVLFGQGRIAMPGPIFAGLDLFMAALFLLAYLKTPPENDQNV
jgi:hypothetical protein